MMKWHKTEDLVPTDKQPIRVIIDGREHCAYWDDDCEVYKVGSGARCQYCGGMATLNFEGENGRRRTCPSHWKPLLPWDME